MSSCRSVLREALAAKGALAPVLQQHVDACAFCGARLRAAAMLRPALRQRPAMSAMSAGAMLEGIHERVVDRCERAPLGRLLADSVPPGSGQSAQDAWPEPLLQSGVAERIAEAAPEPGRLAWSRVRATILGRIAAEVASGPARQRARGRWWIGFVSTAVAAGVVLAVVGGGQRPEPPTIVIQDLSRLPAGGALPGVDFAVVRYGATR